MFVPGCNITYNTSCEEYVENNTFVHCSIEEVEPDQSS